MRWRLVVTIVFAACLFVAASWTPSARSQTSTTPTTPATAPSAAPSQAEDTTDGVDTSAPELVIDVPGTPDETDSSDDGVDKSKQAQAPAPASTPTPTPAPAPVIPPDSS